MLRGCITDLDFDLIEQVFPGIVGYYRELKDKPATFLELWWDFTHSGCGCAKTAQVAATAASPFAANGAGGRSG